MARAFLFRASLFEIGLKYVRMDMSGESPYNLHHESRMV